MLHPYYKNYYKTVWANRPDWITSNNVPFQALWGEHKGSAARTTAMRRPKVVSNNIDDAIDALIDPEATAAAAAADDRDLDKYQQWKKWGPRAEKGSEAANNPIKYWVGLRDSYPNLARMALDLISIPASSCAYERMFSELGELLEPQRRAISPQLLVAIQLLSLKIAVIAYRLPARCLRPTLIKVLTLFSITYMDFMSLVKLSCI
jgi:hypothetical protein